MRGERRVPWWVLPAANCIYVPQSGSRVPNGIKSGWDQSAEWDQGQ